MNYPIVFRVLGVLLVLEGLLMLPPLGISWYFGEPAAAAFLDAILMALMAGFLLIRVKTDKMTVKASEGMAIVAMGWLIFSVVGALPLVWSGSVSSMTDAFFEAVSGFTTTGATIITNIDVLPRGVLFWRSFTHWIGGMGILVFTVAILPIMGIGGFQVFKAESPGPITDRITPRINDTARILYTTYISMTVAEIVLLLLAGMSLYDAVVHTFGTVGTGGFSTYNASITAFSNPMIHWIIGIFMVMAASNFSLYYAVYKGKWRNVVKDQELQLFAGIILIATLLIAWNTSAGGFGGMVATVRDSFFQVASIISTTGYSTADFDHWPTFSKTILLILMFVGGCAGSTGGGMKGIRILLMLKLIKAEIIKIFHPRAVVQIRLGNRTVPVSVMSSTTAFFFAYIGLFGLGALVVSLEDIDMISAISASAACIGNIGPGFGFVGPSRTYAEFSDLSKVVLSGLMLLGRLEIFTILALLAPKTWRRDS